MLEDKIRNIFIVLLLLISVVSFSQDVQINPDGFNVFYKNDTIKISEGYMVNGKPDGYWKNYYDNGIIKSEGNRKNFELDSLWKFYNEEGKIILEITYENGKKNGFRNTYQDKEILKENFVDDVKEGYSFLLYPNLKNHIKTPFVNGLEEGISREYDKSGNIIQLITYKKGYIATRERINRMDSDSLAHGRWLWFSDDEEVILQEGFFKHGLKHGYFKEYDVKGNLISATKYENGEKLEKAEELMKLEVRTDYYPNGKIKIVATYNADGKPEGVRREYNENGEVEKSFIFRNGILIGDGIFTDSGKKEGRWKEYFNDGKLKAFGDYSNNLKNGIWKYYYKNGQLEEVGKFIANKPDSIWQWYYSDGKLLRTENFYNGLPDGMLTEFDKNGSIITQGDYIDGKKEGHWIYNIGDNKTEGEYSEDTRTGLWKSYFDDGSLQFEGKFVDNNPNGEHTWYWGNGKVKKQGKYVMGRKIGDWKKYDKNGLLLIVIAYQGGKEIKYDGIKID